LWGIGIIRQLGSPAPIVFNWKANAKKETQMKQTKYPAGWNERKVRRVLRHYDSQTEGEAIAEDETAFELKDQAVMVVPKKLVSEITRLIERRRPRPNRPSNPR
jgi:hypothetical protein